MGMEFEFEGRKWSYDPSVIDVASAIVIKGHTGHGLRSWSVAVDDWDPAAIQALYWVVKHQNGERCEIASLNFSIGDFMEAFTPAMVAWKVAEVTDKLEELGADPQAAAAVDASTTPAPTPTSAG